MKAIDILKWIVNESIEGELLYFVDVPEEGNEEWEQNEGWWHTWCGSCPPSAIPSGRYLYYYHCLGDFDDYVFLDGKFIEPDAQIELADEEGFNYIYLYKIEE